MHKILIVDDEKDLASLFKEILEQEGYQAYAATDTQFAMDLATKIKFDLALIDIRLPGRLNGVELFLKLKEINPRIKVIMMTGFAVEDLIEKALLEGAYGCIHKPFDPKRVIELIKKIILNNKLILVVDDDADVREILNDTLRMESYNSLSAKDGKEALEILKTNNVNLIILNFCLPDMDGLSLFKEARKIDENIKALLITGYELSSILQREESKYLYGWMKKPVDMKALLNLIKGV